MSNQNQSIEPQILGGINGESSFIQKSQRGIRRVKLERGHSWKIRFLPARLGPSERWYARIAKHWHAQKHVICPRNTHPEFGGDPDADCPVCKMSDTLNDNHSDVISKIGYKLGSTPQWMTYCLVYAKASGGGSLVDIEDPDEIHNVYVYDHYKTTYEELVSFVRNGVSKARPLSVLDYQTGNDFVATKTGKGTRLDKQDSLPIAEEDGEGYEALIEKIESQCKSPIIKIPDWEELNVFALKAEEQAFKQAHAPSRGHSQAGFNEYDDDGDNNADSAYAEEPSAPPRRTNSAPPPAAARRAAPAPVSRGNGNGSGNAAAPARTAPARTAPAAPVRSAPAAAPVRSAAPAARTPATRPAPAPVRSVAPARRAAPAPAPAAPASRRAAVQSTIEEEEALPEENTDLAPATEQPIEEVLDTGEETQDQAELADPETEVENEVAAPPPVAARGALHTSLKSKMAAIRAQEAKG